tara:strand:- start:515 stop:1501 length:987 start_codon:yes stop_codon:yes gene_type:complete
MKNNPQNPYSKYKEIADMKDLEVEKPRPRPSSKKEKNSSSEQSGFPTVNDFKSFNPVEQLPESFYVNVVASRRSGKGVLTEWILNSFQKEKKKKFDAIFLISPTGDLNFPGIPPTYKFTDLSILKYIMAKQREIKAYNAAITSNYASKSVSSRVCVVIDDLAFSGNLHSSKVMNELAMNGRHISNPIDREGNCLSVIVLSQQVNKISPAQRRNNDFIFFNSLSSSLEAEIVLSECFFVLDTSRKGKQAAREMYHELSTSKDYRFIAVGNCIQNKRSLTDYVFTVDAEIRKPFKLFGDRGEWETDTYFTKKDKYEKSSGLNEKKKNIRL